MQLVVKAGDPKAQSLAANDWYRLRRSLEIIKVNDSSDVGISYFLSYDKVSISRIGLAVYALLMYMLT